MTMKHHVTVTTEEQEVRVSQLFNTNTLLFTQQEEEQEEQEVRVSQLFNTNTLLFTQQEEE